MPVCKQPETPDHPFPLTNICYAARLPASVRCSFAAGGAELRQYRIPVWLMYTGFKTRYVPSRRPAGTAALIRVMRANLLDELRKPYVATARAKGMPEWKLILKYPVRLALNPAVSLTAYILPFLVSGSIVVSVVLGLPTVGPILLKALVAQDMFIAGAIILIIGWMTVVGTFFSDLLLVLVDPRVRFEGRG